MKNILGQIPSKYLKYISIIFGGICICLIRNIFLKLYNKWNSYPNGPTGLPLLGCLLSFGMKPRRFLVNIAIKYGAISYVPLISSNNIFISDCKILKKIYCDEKVYDRPFISFFNRIPGFPMINGENWIKRRKYAMETVMTYSKSSFILRNIKNCIDHHIEAIMNEKYIKNKKLWYPEHDVHYMVFNNIWISVFNEQIPFNDPFIAKYCKANDILIQWATFGILFDLMVNCSAIWPEFIQWHISHKYMKRVEDILIDWMQNNGFVVDTKQNILKRENNDNGNNDNVYIDLLIEKVQSKEMRVDQILTDIINVIGAAIDTTTKSSEYGFLLLAKYENIQQMVYNEIIQVMKQHNIKEFTLKIINDLHIFRAFIHEILRISCVTPTGLPHITSKDKSIEIIDGEKIIIPKNSIIHSNTYYMEKCMDWNTGKTLKEENNNIHLEYWLNSKNGKFTMNENFILFGYGKRDCIGQSMAKKVIYVIFGLMMTKYKFIAANNDYKAMDIKQKYSFLLRVHPPIGINVEKR